MSRILGFCAAMVLFMTTTCFAQENPTPDFLSSQLTSKIASFVAINSVEIRSEVNDGDAVRPNIRQRFIAEMEILEDLFRQVDIIDGTPVIEKSASDGLEAKVYGIASSVLKMEEWATSFEIENAAALSSMGRPRSFFESNAVLSGSQEEDTLRQAVLAREKQEQQAATEQAERLRQEAEAKRQALLDIFQGEWKGSYVCGQGDTELTVRIDDVLTDGRMSGAFVFYPTSESRNGVFGEYQIFIEVDEEKKVLQASPGPWVRRPAGFRTVGFEAVLRENRLVGKILSRNCGTMEVVKSLPSE
jgi:hypothetical protein